MNTFFDIPDLTPEQFKKFAAVVYKEAFINLKENKITLLSNRLRKRLRALEINSYDEYYKYLTGRKDPEEIIRFLEVVTTNESYFWRTTQNFEVLKENLVPLLIKQYPGETLQFWSAGCSTGEEPYNLAMELTESMKRNGVFQFKILATDISQRVVDFAKIGSYNGRKIEKVPPAILSRYFNPDPNHAGSYTVRDDIKAKIQFGVENIFTFTPPTSMHMIFCRNVMIYFSRDDQERLVNHFHDILRAGGFLQIGHSESLHMMNTPFKGKNFPEGVVYEKLRKM